MCQDEEVAYDELLVESVIIEDGTTYAANVTIKAHTL